MPAPDPVAPEPTVEERRAAKIAAWQERRRRQGKPVDGGPTITPFISSAALTPRSDRRDR